MGRLWSVIGAQSPVPLLKDENHYPSLPGKSITFTVAEMFQLRQLKTFRNFILSTPGALPPRTCLATSVTSPSLMAEILTVFFPSLYWTDSAPLTLYTMWVKHHFPLQSLLMVFTSFYFSYCQNIWPAGTCQLLLQCHKLTKPNRTPPLVDDFLHLWCPSSGSGINTRTGTNHLTAAALCSSTMEAWNMVHSYLMSPTSLGMVWKISWGQLQQTPANWISPSKSFRYWYPTYVLASIIKLV